MKQSSENDLLILSNRSEVLQREKAEQETQRQAAKAKAVEQGETVTKEIEILKAARRIQDGEIEVSKEEIRQAKDTLAVCEAGLQTCQQTRNEITLKIIQLQERRTELLANNGLPFP